MEFQLLEATAMASFFVADVVAPLQVHEAWNLLRYYVVIL